MKFKEAKLLHATTMLTNTDMKSPTFINEVRRNTEGSVREYLFYDSFKNVKFPYITNKNEQVKIGIFLKQMDDAIMYRQRELDTLKQTKQGFLQKCFQRRRVCAEIRFPGFSKSWEQHKFQDDIISIQTGTNLLGNEIIAAFH
ncbi:restriction endonuclease subunit S [Lentibacillus sp. JNUCC-1]|uniref:restriction endonuclease subunit S n=1 Tax=Lentibacillus sp. JNUCC-1 TaxID=2654513 RepID=UPI0012E73D45|nr:hypothetical protein [Lentibacillus sp. JNUCC-1]